MVQVRADEAALRTDVVRLASRFGRYGYRRITNLLRIEGWQANYKRVERIWRQEGLKVPRRQPERGRLWLGGVLVFPGVWAVWAWLAGWGTVQAQAIAPWVPDQPIVVVAVMVALCVASAIVMLLYWELAVGTLRALRVRLTRGRHARALTRLRAERSRLCDELVAFAEGVELPGLVLPSGRLSRGR